MIPSNSPRSPMVRTTRTWRSPTSRRWTRRAGRPRGDNLEDVVLSGTDAGDFKFKGGVLSFAEGAELRGPCR